MAREFYTITDENVGRAYITAFGKNWRVDGFIGQILKQDIGKRVYKVGDILQVENNEQRDARLKKENMPNIMRVQQLLSNVNAQRRIHMKAGEENGTWAYDFVDGKYYICEVEAVTGAPKVYRRITPALDLQQAEIFVRGALMTLDKDEDGVWELK